MSTTRDKTTYALRTIETLEALANHYGAKLEWFSNGWDLHINGERYAERVPVPMTPAIKVMTAKRAIMTLERVVYGVDSEAMDLDHALKLQLGEDMKAASEAQPA